MYLNNYLGDIRDINPAVKENYARDIVSISGRDDFDELQKDPLFTEIYDTAVRYLDKEIAEEKESNWAKLATLVQKANN